jgi:2-polyprenyl-3-methyl-5-hydroxy-6-metoxy-1,4-benzoquinol methylase
MAVFGEFTDAKQNSFKLLRGYRQKIWPLVWDEMLQNRAEPNRESVIKLKVLDHGREQAKEMRAFLALAGASIEGTDVLEVGCFNGAATFALAELGARRVEGLDVPANFVPYMPANAQAIEEWSTYLTTFREHVGTAFDRDCEDSVSRKVKFRHQDITDLEDEEEWDIIVSWDTLEHVLDPPVAFQAMYRALRPGGIACHRYHPFFCESGAHFDTLDFPWGHVRLGPHDFQQYVRQMRPDEIDVADYRFNRTINRMSFADLKNAVRAAGFQMLSFLPVTSNPWMQLETDFLVQCQANYPTVSLQDLLTSQVWILLKKPSGG